MPVKFITEVVKGLFGVSGSETEEPTDVETNVTVEREIEDAEREETGETESTERDDESGVESESEASEAGEETAAEDGETDANATEDVPVGEISGIGPTYSERLAGIGIETVAELAASDAASVAEAAEVTESRAVDWISQAESW